MSQNNSEHLTHALKHKARELGAAVVGIADLDRLRGLPTSPPDLLAGYPRAVSMGRALAKGVCRALHDGPTAIYARHYHAVNALLDRLSLDVANELETLGAMALPLPATLSVGEKNLEGALSHRAVALAAGLGWQGKSCMLINERYGARLRLVTVLTDAELIPDAPGKNRCGECGECAEACPADAIHGPGTKYHYARRADALDVERCAGLLAEEFAGRPDIGVDICGICIAACPFSGVSRDPKS